MADITTDVMIVGTGPAGSATAAALSSCEVENFLINRYRWLANTPRAHITNQRTMEVLRDLGKEVDEFDCHDVEMNQRYVSSAVVPDGTKPPGESIDMELHYVPTTRPGARLPHVWIFNKDGRQHSTLDITGKGAFALITGIGGEAWVEAAKAEAAKRGIAIAMWVIGPRRDYDDHVGDWTRAREIEDSGCLLVRPDQHVAFRARKASKTAAADLASALTAILGK